MASFLEKLKKGMGVEIPQDLEPEEEIQAVEEPEIKIEEEKKGAEQGPDKSLVQVEKKPAAKKREKTAKKLKKKTAAGFAEKTKKEKTKKTKIIARKKEEDKTEEKTKAEKRKESQKFDWQSLAAKEGELAVDLYQTENELVIQTAIAGVRAEDLDISIDGDVFLIKGARDLPPEKEKRNYFCQECYWGPFSRQIILPEEVDPSRTKAEMNQGVLTIRMPKIQRKKKIKIELKNC